MGNYSSELDQIQAALASIARDLRSRISFRLRRKQVPEPPDGWRVGNRKPPHEDNRITYWAPWGSAYIVVKYNAETDNWWTNYYFENTLGAAYDGGTLLNLSSQGYDCSYDDAIQAALDFMHDDHPKYSHDQLRPE